MIWKFITCVGFGMEVWILTFLGQFCYMQNKAKWNIEYNWEHIIDNLKENIKVFDGFYFLVTLFVEFCRNDINY